MVMASDQITITVTTPAGSSLTLQPTQQSPAESGRTLDLFSALSGDAAETPPEPVEAAPAPAETVPAAKKPWEELSRGSKGINFQPDPELYAKMIWCKENVPMMSLLKVARDGANAECDRLIALYYKR
jgi:hypothetical protein